MIPFARGYNGDVSAALVITISVAVAIYFVVWLFKRLFREPSDSDDDSGDDDDDDGDGDGDDSDD